MASSVSLQNHQEKPVSVSDDDGAIETMMAVAGGPWGKVHTAIHESLTLSALGSVANSAVSHTTQLSTASNAEWEFIRGVVWNDDPAGELFDDSSSSNHTYSTGARWLYYYNLGEADFNPAQLSGDRFRNIIGRSHYGDLQFLHCMASVAGETPQETKRKVMVWMEVMYKLASGEDPNITPKTTVEDTKLGALLSTPPDVTGGALPPYWMPLSYMFAPKSTYSAVDIRRRALGSLFHVIQDSYAHGHTERVLLNPQDQINKDPITFKPGMADRWGAILNFHTYFGQNDNAHAHYDHPQDPIPDPGNLSNLDQWNNLVGCRDAVDKCIEVARMRFSGKTWGGPGGVEEYLDQQVFAVDPRATPANDQV